MKQSKTEKPQNREAVFTKTQILESKKYENRKDLIGALLDDGQIYTILEVDKAIANFLKGKVK